MRPRAFPLSRLIALLLFSFLLSACMAIAGPAGFAASGSELVKPKVPDPVVTVTVRSVSKRAQQGVPVTFGQPFVVGDVPHGSKLQAITFDGKPLPTQVDWKATNSDGSLRHGIVTFILPHMSAGGAVHVGLYRRSGKRVAKQAASPGETLPRDLNAQIKLRLEHGGAETASIKELSNKNDSRSWLSGPLVDEWLMHGQLKKASGEADPYLSARFYVRYYPTVHRARIEMIVENDWAFQPKPHNITYDAHLFINGQQVYKKLHLTHTTHARWRKVFWEGDFPEVYVDHDLAYLKATGTIPNYDPKLRVPESAVEKLYQRFSNSNTGPMGASIIYKRMATAGGRPDIGPLPRWTVLRLLTGDPRLIYADDAIGALSGSWPIHLRDNETDRPVTLKDHPHLSVHPNLIGKSVNPYPVPAYKGRPSNLDPNSSHEPSLAFVPYLLTGDYYYLEELQFWAAWNPLRTSPAYRGYDKGLLKWLQVRGQAWSLRTLGQVAYITPDDSPLKSYWNHQLQNNLAWYNRHYPDNPTANKLGFLVGLMPYHNHRGLAPWQDDFFTWAMGYLVNLGFQNARPMLDYKARFPVGRMTAPGVCWALGAIYTLKVRDARGTPFYDTFAKAYAESESRAYQGVKCASAEMAAHMGKQYKPGDMSGYPWSPQGFPANMQPALATAVDAGVPKADEAWTIFMNRTTKPNYSGYPNWDIVPRKTP